MSQNTGKPSAEGGVYAIHHPEEQRKDASAHLRRGSLVCVHMAGGPTPPTASERAIGGGEVTTWPMWVCTGLSAGSLGKSMAKVPTGSGENESTEQIDKDNKSHAKATETT